MSKRGIAAFVAALVVAAAVTAALAALLLNIQERKLEAKDRYLKVVRVGEETTDPAPWGSNWPRQYDSYQRTADATHTTYGGSDGAPATSRLEIDRADGLWRWRLPFVRLGG